MDATRHIPAFPCQLELLASQELLELLSAAEVGTFYRLVRAAWRQDPPCTLPDDDAYLAAVARVSDKEWVAARPRLSLAFSASGGNPGGRLVLAAALKVHDALLVARAKLAAAGRASGESRRRRLGANNCSTDVQHSLNGVRHPPIPPDPGFPALSPCRSTQEQIDPSARAPAKEVIARLGERARAIAFTELRDWRRRTAMDLIQKAIASWRASGDTTCPISKASELADGPDSDPARVDYLIESASAQLLQAKAAKDGRNADTASPFRKSFNPVGFLIAGLGLSGRRFGRPADVPLWVLRRWDARESKQAHLIQTAASIRALQSAQPQPGDSRAASQGA